MPGSAASKRARRALTIALCAALAACGGVPQPTPTTAAPTLAPQATPTPTPTTAAPTPGAVLAELGAGQTVTLRPGETASLAGGVSVRFDEVVEDSRCPENARCIWQGRVVVAGHVTAGGRAQPFTLGTAAGFADAPTSVAAGPHTLSIAEVEPYPATPAGVPAADYVLTLAVD